MVFVDNSIHRYLVLYISFVCKFCCCNNVFKEIRIFQKKKKIAFFSKKQLIARKYCEKEADFFGRITAKKSASFFTIFSGNKFFFEEKAIFFVQNIPISCFSLQRTWRTANTLVKHFFRIKATYIGII